MEDKKLQPSEEEQKWLKDLFDQADTDASAPEQEDFNVHDEQWLQDLFASAELAVEQEFAPEQAVQDTPSDAAPEAEAPSMESAEVTAEEASASTEAAPAEESPAETIGEETESPEAEDEEDALAADPDIVAFLETILPPEPGEEPQGETETDEASTEETEPSAADTEDAAKEDEAEETDETAPTKRRPKNNTRYGLFGLPHVVVTGVWLAIILMIGGFLGQWIWKGASDVLAFGREEKLVTITITENDDLDSVIHKLHSAGLIHEPMWFRWYAQISDAMDDIGVGTYELNTLFDYRALVSHMSPNSSARVTVKVVIPEGYTCAQIFRLLEEKGVCSVADLESASIGGDFSDYWFLDGMTQNQKYCLEGYLFPDTYEFYIADDANRVLSTMLKNFGQRFTDIMMDKLAILNETMAQKMRENGMSESYIAEHAFTIREAVIIASMIEKETTGASESYSISSVIYNRLTYIRKYPCLELKWPLIYITGHTTLTEEDYGLVSPYNTFLHAGLIPTPICNPSRASLDAALDPADTDHYYFAYNPATNSHHFFASEEEYLAFLEELAQQEEVEEAP